MEVRNLLEEMAKAIEAERPACDKDYVKDGLVYCHKCHTPKQHRITLEGRGELIVPCTCECRQAEIEAERKALVEQARRERIRELRKTGFPDYEMRFMTFDKDDGSNEKLSTLARRYVEHFDEMLIRNKGLLLFGTVGTGKTFMSTCIANALTDQGYPCLVTNFTRLCNTVSGMYDGKQAYIDGLSRFDLLVIDDLYAERDTEYMGEIVQNIIDTRYRSGKPMIVTTNLSRDELMHPTDIRRKRIYSRLFEMCFPYEVKGNDRRKKILNDESEDLKELLGLANAD